MPTLETLATFAAAAVVFCVVPGPNVLYIVGRTLAEGRRSGIASVLGVTSSGFVHVAFAALGLSAMLAASATAYDVVRYAGAAYLVALGVRTLVRSRGRAAVPGGPPREPRSPDPVAAYRQGFVVNLLSPKTALFFLALLPQFVDPAQGAAALQLVVLGLILVAVGFVNDGLYALGAGALARRLHRRPAFVTAGERASGVVCIVLGLGTALAGDRRAR